MNLLQETKDFLKRLGISSNDVLWVGIENKQYMTWQEFAESANFDYDNGFGGQEVEPSLIVVGNNFWLERHEYDGSEWWEYKSMPVMPPLHNPKMELKRDIMYYYI